MQNNCSGWPTQRDNNAAICLNFLYVITWDRVNSWILVWQLTVELGGTVLCVLDSMCPCLYVSISLCVQGSMWQISCRIDPLWLWFYVSRVLCGPGSMWPLMYKLTLCVVGPMCPGSNVTNALCVQGSMCPWLYVATVYMLLYSI